MTTFQSVQLSKALQLVSEDEQSYESTMLTSPLPCESSLNMEELTGDDEIWLEDLAGEETSPTSTESSHSLSSDTLVLPPRRRLSFGSRRNSADKNALRKFQSKQDLLSARRGGGTGESTRKRTHSMDDNILSHSAGAIDCGPASASPHSTCFLRTRSLSAGAIDIASWKLADRCRRRSKGSSCLQEASNSVRSLPREAELVELEERSQSSMRNDSNHDQTGVRRNVSTSRSRSPGTRQGATRAGRRGSFYGSLEERFSKSTGDIDFTASRTYSSSQRSDLLQTRRASSFGVSDSRSSSKKQAEGAGDRRRMPKGKQLLLLKGVSSSVRALPRETELALVANDPDEIDRLEDSFQAIFDTITDIDTKVRSIRKEFSIMMEDHD